MLNQKSLKILCIHSRTSCFPKIYKVKKLWVFPRKGNFVISTLFCVQGYKMSYLQSTCKFVTKKLLNFIQQLIQIKQWQHFLKRRYKNQFEFIVEAVFKSQRTTFKLCCSIARFFLKYNSIIFIMLLHGAYLNLINLVNLVKL